MWANSLLGKLTDLPSTHLSIHSLYLNLGTEGSVKKNDSAILAWRVQENLSTPEGSRQVKKKV